MRVWVTRTEPGASRLAAALRAAGHTVWTRPTLDIEHLAAPPPPGEFALTVFLSEHAVAGAFANGWAPGPAMAIGTATAAALRTHGVCPLLPAAATSEGVIARLADMAQRTPDGETAAAAKAPNAGGAATPAKRLPRECAHRRRRGRARRALGVARRARHTRREVAGVSPRGAPRRGAGRHRHRCHRRGQRGRIAGCGKPVVCFSAQPRDGGCDTIAARG